MAEVTFKLKNKEYELPDFLSIGDYVKIFKIKDLFEDEYMKAKVVNLLTGCPMDVLMKSENLKVDFLATTIFAMVPKPPYKLYDRFELDGVHYGIFRSYKELSFGEFADLDTLLSKKPEEIMDYLHVIAAIMYRPIVEQKSEHNFKIEEYNSQTVEERAFLFKNKLDVKYVLGGQFFFINFAKNYLNYIPASLTQRIKKEWMMMKFLWRHRSWIWKYLLKKDSDGMSFLIEYQKIELQHTMKLLKKELSK